MTAVADLPMREFEERHESQEEQAEASLICTAEVAECTCPDFCERDHDRD
jgi:hypothetical protein